MQALKEKELGNQAYKGKKFEEALQHYDKAFALNPTNIALLTNKAAVFFEQQLWEKCLEMCDLAVEKGRECRADYKIIAKFVCFYILFLVRAEHVCMCLQSFSS